MESLNELYQRRSALEKELNKITTRKYGSSQWAPGVYDKFNSESYAYNEYTDDSLARSLQRQLQEIQDKIDNYAMYVEREKEIAKIQGEMVESARTRQIDDNARKLYESALEEYQKKSFLGKVGLMFSGKKPKRNLTDKEISEIYGRDSVLQLDKSSLEIILEKKTEEYAAAIAWCENNNELDENMRKQLIIYYDEKYKKEISELQDKLKEIEGKRRGL